MKNKRFLVTKARKSICLILILALLCAVTGAAFAAANGSDSGNGSQKGCIVDAAGNTIKNKYVCPETKDNVHEFTLTASGKNKGGYVVIKIEDKKYYTEQIAQNESMKLFIQAEEGTEIKFSFNWGKSLANKSDELYGNGDTIAFAEKKNPFAGKKISIMGDSISTYMGWSDKYPLTDEDCAFRYGEPYYGPVGSDCHNTELLVTDTWWHQAATQLGAEILVSNAGNSTGVFHASYPANADWDQYLKDMLAYKTRPYHMGTAEEDPDIIALYIGSNEIARVSAAQQGSNDAIDYSQLIKENADGTYTYADPKTVAEGYAILLHKLEVTYPEAEIYCFTVVPNSGGYLSTINKRMAPCVAFNEMLKGVAAHYDAIVVDIFDEFQLDPDGDGVAQQEDFDVFKTYFNGDPHPNASGFDVITKRFVETVLANSKYNK